MEANNRIYAAIDLKSFYASVECAERGLDPLTTNLVVADVSRTEKTICLAVSPSLKAHGIPGRARLFEVIQAMQHVNAERMSRAPHQRFHGESSNAIELAHNPALKEGFIIAKPRMSHYIATSARIYSIYLKYASADDIHVYSVDEVFIDITHYLRYHGCSAHELVRRIINDIQTQTHITATAGIGTNMYLAKVAMDIVAKHIPADEDGVRIAELNERTYRELLWDHTPITDFWRVGRGIARRLEHLGLVTMGDIARCSIGKANDYYNEDLLYRTFGVNAQLLIDHAWGWEPCTMADIKAFKPRNSSVGHGQVLHEPYTVERARIIVAEMADELALELVSRNEQTRAVDLSIGFDRASLEQPNIRYVGPVKLDYYGRRVPKSVHHSQRLAAYTASADEIRKAVLAIYDALVPAGLLIRRINITAPDIRPMPAGNMNNDLNRQTENGEGELGNSIGEVTHHDAWFTAAREDYDQPDLFSAALSAEQAHEDRAEYHTDTAHGTDGPTQSTVKAAERNDARKQTSATATAQRAQRELNEQRALNVQRAVLAAKQKFGGNAVFKAMDLDEGATARERNQQIGGHAS